MNICVGTTNSAKLDAVREILQDYPHLQDSVVVSKEVESGVSDQPKSLEESVQGAMNRALGAFQDCTYSIGIESGLMAVSQSKSGFMDTCVCAIYDGTEYHLGMSSVWEAPKLVMHHIVHNGLDMTQAAIQAGLTNDPKVGAADGLIGIVTKGRLTRKAQTKEALRTALIHLEP